MGTVIIGNGGAALESVMALRNGGYDSEIHLFSDSVSPAFNPTLITYFIGGKIEPEDIYFKESDFYDRHGVKLHPGSKVVKVDGAGKTVRTADGISLKYDHCIVCSGASPFIPEEYKRENAYTIRSVDEAAALKRQISAGKKALVAGASMIGIKVVEALVKQGVDVTLSELQPHMFPISAHPNCAKMVERMLEKEGVRLMFGNRNPDLSQYDFIVVCVGVRANVDFIDPAQVKTDKGILVDKFMRTNCDDLYAAGDCAQISDVEYGDAAQWLWPSARYMGRTAGKNIAGGDAVCRKVIRHVNTNFFDINFASVGVTFDSDDVFERTFGEKYIRIVWEDNWMVGLNLLNMPDVSGILMSQALKAPKLSDPALNMVFDKYPPIREAFLGKAGV